MRSPLSRGPDDEPREAQNAGLRLGLEHFGNRAFIYVRVRRRKASAGIGGARTDCSPERELSFTRFALGVALLAICIGPVGIGASRFRLRLLSGWTGAPARLAEAILFLALLFAPVSRRSSETERS